MMPCKRSKWPQQGVTVSRQWGLGPVVFGITATEPGVPRGCRARSTSSVLGYAAQVTDRAPTCREAPGNGSVDAQANVRALPA
jgi:hypothetical protein